MQNTKLSIRDSMKFCSLTWPDLIWPERDLDPGMLCDLSYDAGELDKSFGTNCKQSEQN